MDRDQQDPKQQLQDIARELEDLTEGHLAAHRRDMGYQVVVGEGSPQARVMFIGEAPGAAEAASGRPFVGRAGRLLDDLLASIGLEREQVYITNIVKDRPPDNRDPRKAEITRYAPFLERQIAVLQPDVIVTLGRFAMNFILKTYDKPQLGKRIGELQGQSISLKEEYGTVTLIPLYHPAASFYNPRLREDLEQGIRKVKDCLPDEAG